MDMLLANPQDRIGAAEKHNPPILPLNLDVVVGLPHGLLLVAVHHPVCRHGDSRRRQGHHAPRASHADAGRTSTTGTGPSPPLSSRGDSGTNSTVSIGAPASARSWLTRNWSGSVEEAMRAARLTPLP